MPIETGHHELDQLALGMLNALVRGEAGDAASILTPRSAIRESATHDFSTYRFLFEPRPLDRFWQTGALPTALLEGLRGVVRTAFSLTIPDPIHYRDRSGEDGGPRAGDPLYSDRALADRLFNGIYRTVGLPTVALGYARAGDTRDAWAASFLAHLSRILVARLEAAVTTASGSTTHEEGFSYGDLNEILEDEELWGRATLDAAGQAQQSVSVAETDFALPPVGPGVFQPFQPGSVNFGLQIVFRQAWTPLGVQQGEIVRTVPLGPGQSETVSVKVVRRKKSQTQAEIATSLEQATESSAATKDSTEVVEEASEAMNWSVEAEGSVNYGMASGSLKAGMGGENAASSREAKSRLNETMAKTVGKIRRETKVIVSHEHELTSESTRTSEIKNTNDEVAVTYVYSRLQRQYEVFTYLAQVNTVIFVAEDVPTEKDLDRAWFQRYGWILSRVLLDDSFAADLATVRSFHGDLSDGDDAIDEKLTKIVNKVGQGIPYGSATGTPPDVLSAPQEAYERELERKRERGAARRAHDRSLGRLRRHVADNLLHYCRAIWRSEDPDTRMMRYSTVDVPVRWALEPVERGYEEGARMVWVPAPQSAADTEKLSDLVNPAGPIGFAGNYAVFYLREGLAGNQLLDLLSEQRLPYLRIHTTAGTAGENVRTDVSLRAVAGPDHTRDATYILEWSDTDGGGQIAVHSGSDDEGWDPVDTLPLGSAGGTIRLPDLRVTIRPEDAAAAPLRDGDRFVIRVRLLPQLEDPDLKALRWRAPTLDADGEAAFFTASVIREMVEFFPDVATVVGADESWAEIDSAGRAALRVHAHRYRLRSAHTRRLLLDTNNVLLTRIVDDASTLEPFKGLHRYLDVLKSVEELRGARLENDRRSSRLEAQRLGDPDTERTVVIREDSDADVDVDV